MAGRVGDQRRRRGGQRVRGAAADAHAEAARAAAPETLAPVRRLRVLVVDDQTDMADVMAVLVQMLGHDARAAYDGKSGPTAARLDRPDVIFVDIGMAGMSEYQFAVSFARIWGCVHASRGD